MPVATPKARPRVKLVTVGCRLNQAESDAIAEQLAGYGFVGATTDERADVVVVNTCTVTTEATKASRMAIRRAARANPDARIVVTGCYAVSDPDEVEAIEGVDLVLGNDSKERFAEALGAAPATGPLLGIGFRGARPVPLGERVRANLKVQTGCDEWCTFCIIPTTRGPVRSMNAGDLVAEARARVSAGARELVITGVHLGKYAYDAGGDERELIALLERLLEIDDLWRIRLSSILSNHLTPAVVDLIATSDRICPHLHVPLQSGDDGVLADMNRPYRITHYIDAVEQAKSVIPNLALATDVIVGFPTETDAAFEETLAVVRRLEFSKLHVFRYSPRPGTPAATMPEHVAPEIKKERSKRLIAAGNELRKRFLEAHIGAALEVLVEDERQVDGRWVCSGQTGDYVRVRFEAEGRLGQMVTVKGERVRADGLAGSVVEEVRV